MKLYASTSFLSESVEMIKKGEVQKAMDLLKKKLKEESKRKKLAGQIHNNLGICHLLESSPRFKKAKFHVDQAGILLSSPPEIIHNARVITYFFQSKFKIIKKGRRSR